MAVIAEETAAFVEAGDVAIWVATASVDRVPQTTRSMGARVAGDHDRLWLFLPSVQGMRALEVARVGATIAATFVRIHDYRAVQIKGEIATIRLAVEDERRWPEAYRDRFAEASVRVGMPREASAQMAYWPCTMLEVIARELYVQTPGSNAGARL